MSIKYSRNYKRIFTTSIALVIAIGSIVPSSASAFTLALPVLASDNLVANITPELPSITPANDEENSTDLPDYDYSDTGHVTAPTSPITEPSAIPPKKKPATKTVKTAAKKLDQPLVLQGEASYYSWDGCLGCNPLRVMANGQQLNDNALTMAIGADKSYLVGHRARVTHLATEQSVDVLITDTGGFYQSKYGSRVADLTIATKNAIGIRGGTAQVKVEVF